MSTWKNYENVEIHNIYKSINKFSDQYLIKLRVPNKDSIFADYHEIEISGSKFEEKIKNVFEDKTNIEYFSFGMQDIDLYKTNNGKYGITHSPHEGLNLQFILDDKAKDMILTLI